MTQAKKTSDSRYTGDHLRFLTMEITWPPRFVRIRKISEAPNPIFPAIPPADHLHGSLSTHGTLPVLYSIHGWLMRLPLAGEPVRVLRYARNDVIKPGLYCSSEVVRVPRDGEFETLNSVYHWEQIAAPASPIF